MELILVGAAERQADGDVVVGGDEVIDVYLDVGEGALDQPEAVLPGVATWTGSGISA